MERPTRRERSRLQLLRSPAFTIKIDQGEVVRQLERPSVVVERRP